ncbi:MAG: isoprenyl transferase [Clostridia bacterium]|nr:isoprenyl transferase [Clostridia bacterium]
MFHLFKSKKNEKLISEIDKNNLPNHVGIIMDGNGRWAKKRGLPRSAGHRVGAANLKTITEFASDMGIRYITAYAFSTENWKRPKEEVDALMELLLEYLRDKKLLEGNQVRVKFIGDRSVLTDEIRREMDTAEEESAHRTRTTLYLAINYGGQQEIVNAVKNIAKKVEAGQINIDDISLDAVGSELYTEIPDVDLIIRPSGEYRLSNFLLWQSAYSEFWFSNINWPDFTKEDFTQAILDYQNRNRRFGGV